MAVGRDTGEISWQACQIDHSALCACVHDYFKSLKEEKWPHRIVSACRHQLSLVSVVVLVVLMVVGVVVGEVVVVVVVVVVAVAAVTVVSFSCSESEYSSMSDTWSSALFSIVRTACRRFNTFS